MNKIKRIVLIALISSFGVLSFSNDGGSSKKLNFESIKENYQSTKEKLDNLENKNKEVISDNIKNKFQVLSGKSAAGLNIGTEFNYSKSSTYNVYTKPNFTTTLKFNADEEVIYVGGGNTQDFEIDTTQGSGDNSTFIFIKPQESGLKTNLVVITTKRTYFIYLESTSNEYNPLIQWKYPFESNINFVNSRIEKEKKNEVELSVKDVKELDFNYSWNKENKIKVQTVYNDGEKTIVLLNEKMQEAPVIYEFNSDKQLAMINYRFLDNKIVIDKVVDSLQLKLGNDTLDIKKSK